MGSHGVALEFPFAPLFIGSPKINGNNVTPGFRGKTECIAYVCQDPFSTHMLMSQV